MTKLVQAVGVLALLQGVGAVAHHFADWFNAWSLVHRSGLFDGYEVFAGVTLIVVGLAVCGAADNLAR